MEGQADIGEKELTVDKRFQFIPTVEGCKNRTMGKWYDAIPPITRCNNKAGIVDYFGRKLVKDLPKNIRVGIVSVALSGANILLFNEDKYKEYLNAYNYTWYQNGLKEYGHNPYKRLIKIAKIAKKKGVIRGVLFHQGENNVGSNDWPENVKIIYNNILGDLKLKAEKVPLLVGEMVRKEKCGRAGQFNEIIDTISDIIPTSYIISSEDLKPKRDCLHFTNDSYVTFGERYAKQMEDILRLDDDVSKSSANNNINSYFNNVSFIFGLLIIIITILF
ncbi:hypothetical protein BCR36DRAFT_579251 [Piromyces finnis]|uniref:Sialate O-acetylesterase domain-containing protein n=1 Tax=Piromyces finnis TaxID=1754191 RepID=A0A1Y1VQ06_9FUNG|nr:hypothetical protein BCR36DRAFT_579251 [Piromyces finnis]|eukprot:ORX61223.1 hypothetical protein BCR36DRAFT_579251 [Piromyces finnis]